LKKFNYMGNGAGAKFLKKLMKKVNLLESVQSFEDRFMKEDDKYLLENIIGSLQKGHII
jgi:hypothetical protein